MFKKALPLIAMLAVVSLVLTACPTAGGPSEILIGINAPMTGDIPKVGEGTKYAAEIAVDEINSAGGLEVGGKKYKIKTIIEDNESTAEGSTAAATKLITQDNVLIMVGAQASKQAIPTGEVADANETPCISPWSTNPRTTKDRPWVFRACFLDDFQGMVLAKFAKEEFGAKKVAVLYDIASDYPKGLAEFFKAGCEKVGLEVVAFESFTTKDRDFSAQLTKIKNSGADILFTPQYYDEVPLIVKQAKELGWDKIIFGSDSWAGGDLASLCGDDCVGYRFTTHYAMVGAKGKTKKFIDAFKAKYGYEPSDVGALAYDAAQILLEAIKNTGGLTGDLEKDRDAIKDQLGAIKEWKGVTGTMNFTPEGDPIKCAVICEYNKEHKFELVDWACPAGVPKPE